uniref:Uncharacterized protein n=1 Tax=Tetraselmis sp. GSL018 TaxID=582737 RepID=A0A061R3L2_9CHLO
MAVPLKFNVPSLYTPLQRKLLQRKAFHSPAGEPTITRQVVTRAEYVNPTTRRRLLLAAGQGAGLWLSLQAPSEGIPDETLTDDEIRTSILANSNVVPALTTSEYVLAIQR